MGEDECLIGERRDGQLRRETFPTSKCSRLEIRNDERDPLVEISYRLLECYRCVESVAWDASVSPGIFE
jgi:hypothetical protein